METLIAETFGDISDIQSNKGSEKEKGKKIQRKSKPFTPIPIVPPTLYPIPEAVASSDLSDTNPVPQPNPANIFGDPRQNAKDMYDNYFAPQISAPHPLLQQVRRELYRRAFMDIINKELSPDSCITNVSPDNLYNIVVTACKTIGMIA